MLVMQRKILIFAVDFNKIILLTPKHLKECT